MLPDVRVDWNYPQSIRPIPSRAGSGSSKNEASRSQAFLDITAKTPTPAG
jgi:hypothetical protein